MTDLTPAATEELSMTDQTEIHDEPSVVPNRRRFFGAVGALGATAFLAACGDDDEDATAGEEPAAEDDGDTTTTAGEGGGGGDVAIAEFAASLEVLAVNTYQAGLDAATAGDLGAVPPAVAEYATTALSNHQDYLDAWNEIVTTNGGEEVSAPPAELEKEVNGKFAEVKDIAGLAMLALELEQIAADTYLSVLPVLSTGELRKLAGSIQYTDRQAQAILLFALGEYPVPEVFQSPTQAVSPG